MSNELKIIDSAEVFNNTVSTQIAQKYPNASVPQVKLFLAYCANMHLNPLAGDVDLIVAGSRTFYQIRIDGYRKIASRTGLYNGQTPQEWCGKDGVWRDVWLGPGNPSAARCGIYRKGQDKPVYGVATWAEFGKGGSWASMPSHMLSKVAESLALRKAFPEQFAGSYTEFEHIREAAEPQLSPLNEVFDAKTKSEPLAIVEAKEEVQDTHFERFELGEYVIDHACRFAGKRLSEIDPEQARQYMHVLEGTDKPQSVALLKKMKLYFNE